MAWGSLTPTQFVSFTDAQGSPFVKISTLPTSDQFMTKQNCLDYMQVRASALSGYTSNQWIQKADLVSAYTELAFIPYYGLVAGVGLHPFYASALLAKRALVDFVARLVTGYSFNRVMSTGTSAIAVGDLIFNKSPAEGPYTWAYGDGYFLVDKLPGGTTNTYFTTSLITDPIVHIVNGAVTELLYVTQADIDYNAKAWRPINPYCIQS